MVMDQVRKQSNQVHFQPCRLRCTAARDLRASRRLETNLISTVRGQHHPNDPLEMNPTCCKSIVRPPLSLHQVCPG